MIFMFIGSSKALIEEEKFRKAGKRKYEHISEKILSTFSSLHRLATNNNNNNPLHIHDVPPRQEKPLKLVVLSTSLFEVPLLDYVFASLSQQTLSICRGNNLRVRETKTQSELMQQQQQHLHTNSHSSNPNRDRDRSSPVSSSSSGSGSGLMFSLDQAGSGSSAEHHLGAHHHGGVVVVVDENKERLLPSSTDVMNAITHHHPHTLKGPHNKFGISRETSGRNRVNSNS